MLKPSISRVPRQLAHALIFSIALLIGSPLLYGQQPPIPKCPDDRAPQTWRNCTGALTLPDGSKYVGEINEGLASGQGTVIQSSGRAFKYVGELRNNVLEGYGSLTYRDGGSYVGDLVRGVYEGEGKLLFADGGSYVGQFVEGKFHGRGTLINKNGDRYVGGFREGNRHGQGAFTGVNGDRFQGEFRDGSYHGKGTLSKRDGSEYSGDFREGLFHGRGNLTSRDGSRYEGDFRSGQRNGKGIFTNALGDKYEGEHREDKWNGQGTLVLRNGESYSGEFRDGEFYGNGVYSFPDGGKYEGDFRDNRFNGNGRYTFADGGVYVGEFRDGGFDGNGTFTAKSGEKYVGEYKRGKRDGRGTLTYSSGVKYIGEFRDGEASGLGVEYLSSGTVAKRGVWKDGKLLTEVALDLGQFPFDSNISQNGSRTANSPAAEAEKSTASTTPVVDATAIAARQRRADELAKVAAAEKERAAALERDRLFQEQQRKEAEIRALLGKRIALVIGNATYDSSPLKNPENDANDVSQVLKESGFTVIDVRNGSLGKMRQAVRQFGDMLVDHDVGLVYYSGHGVEVNGRNYMIPVNADIQREDEVADQSVDVNLILEKMATANKAVNILIMDACRDDPFGRGFRSRSKGLAVLDAPRGTIIAYATSPGRVADDGQGRNSPYTKNLIKYIQVPNKPVEAVFKDVRRAVQQDTKGAQTPWENTSLSGDFFFRIQR